LISRRPTIAAPSIFIALFVALPQIAFSHVIPDDVAVQMFAKPEGGRLHLLVRVPFTALADIIFPSRAGGDLDLPQVDAMLAAAGKTWISDWIDLYEDGTLLPKPQAMETRVSLPYDTSFASYEEAWAHLMGPRLPGSVQLFPDQAMLDVLFDYPIRSDRSDFAIHSRLARLAVRVVTTLRFVPANGAMRVYGYQGDPGLFNLDPGWREPVRRFVPLGFFQILKGTDYLLFLFCVALLFRRSLAIIQFIAAFTVAHSITLIASAYGLAPDALWFPVLFETLIAISIVYMAFENIVAGTPAQYRWMIAFGFGLAYGFGFSFALRPALQFGGAHVLASILSFNIGVELGQFLILALLIPALNLLFRLGVPERIATIFLAALAAHAGWHRMIDRARWLSASQFNWTAGNPALLAAAQRWLMIALILGALAYLVFGVLRPRHEAQPVR
jgi:HupE/UreJ protein